MRPAGPPGGSDDAHNSGLFGVDSGRGGTDNVSRNAEHSPGKEQRMSTFRIKGLMLDPARLTEPMDLYRRYVDLAASYGYGTLLWHFTDSTGCAMVFPRRPEVASPYAFTPEETARFVEFCAERGIDVIPEVECFGHTSYILRLDQYRHLRDNPEGAHMEGICPFHEEAKAILRDLLCDTAEIFQSPYIHTGLDEVAFGAHPLTRERLKTRRKWELYAEHVGWLNEEVRSLGRTMMMWGDHLLETRKGNAALDNDAYSSEMAAVVPKDIVLVDWHYEAEPDPATVDFLMGRGFDVVAGSAVQCSGVHGLPTRRNMDNLRNFTHIAAEADSPHMLGVIHTVWCPWRTLPGTTAYPIAAGGELLQTGGELPAGFTERFVADYFGLAETEDAAAALDILYGLSPHRSVEMKRNVPTQDGDLDGVTSEDIAADEALRDAAARAVALLREAEPGVTKNADLFGDILFSAEYYELLGELGIRLQEIKAADAEPGRAEDVAGMLASAVERLASMYGRGIAQWNRTRFDYASAEEKQPVAYNYTDCPLGRMRQGLEYLRGLRASVGRGRLF